MATSPVKQRDLAAYARLLSGSADDSGAQIQADHVSEASQKPSKPVKTPDNPDQPDTP